VAADVNPKLWQFGPSISYVSAWNYSKIDQSKEASSRLKIPTAEMVENIGNFPLSFVIWS